jgi:DNA-binding NarL/FixJ family response regulator
LEHPGEDRPTATDHSDCCVVLGVQHRRLAEGLRDLLASAFEPVVLVSDEGALVEAAERLRPQLAVVSLSLGGGDIVGLLRRLRAGCPDMGLIVLSLEDAPTVERVVLAAGADRLITMSDAAFELLPAAEALIAAPHLARILED